MSGLFRIQSTNFMHIAGRQLQRMKANGVCGISGFIAAVAAGELCSLFYVPPVVEAMGAVALFAKAVHERRKPLQETQELTWDEYFQARNPGMEREEPFSEGQVFKGRSPFALVFAGSMAVGAIIGAVDEDIEIIPSWIVASVFEKGVDFLENSLKVDPNHLAGIKQVLKEFRSHSDEKQ